ncbi:MAG: hypothetical protein Udaeo2_34390 [Candidatus Udaeobacter sp.]|nr:MAG: hypothetical protein Udaeo2_34390 [Candidatus Udaeobacter sp.]
MCDHVRQIQWVTDYSVGAMSHKTSQRRPNAEPLPDRQQANNTENGRERYQNESPFRPRHFTRPPV